MSRKHFVAIAEAIRFMDVDDATRARIAHDMASTLRGFNAQFDRDRFVSACTKAKAGK
jgi:hypothetical protein